MITWAVIIVVAILLIFAASPISWGAWAKKGWRDLHDANINDMPSDLKVRAYYRKLAFENIPDTEINSLLKFHDPKLDEMIAEGDFASANNYRMLQVRQARLRRDADSLYNYTVYKKVISTMEAYEDEMDRKALRKKYGHIREDKSIEHIKARRLVAPMRLIEREEDFADEPLQYDEDDAMQISGTPKKQRRAKTKSAFLEIHTPGPAFKRPPLEQFREKFDPLGLGDSLKVPDDVVFEVPDPEGEVDYKDAIRKRAAKFAKKKGIVMQDEGDESDERDDEIPQEKPLVGTVPVWNETYDTQEEKKKAKYRFKTEKIKTDTDYKHTIDYEGEHELVHGRIRYKNDEALETSKSADNNSDDDIHKVSEDNVWGTGFSSTEIPLIEPAEPVESREIEPEPDTVQQEPDQTAANDDFTDLIDI